MTVAEEVDIGTEIGIVQAVDQDIGENANIGYLITYGNEDNMFVLNTTEDNRAVLLVGNRLDRETASQYIITIKCFKSSALPSSLRKPYNRQDPSERQIRIRVSDVDDNLPQFSDNNVTLGVRVNVPVDTLLLTLSATDLDVDAAPISFQIESIKFNNFALSENKTYFSLDNSTGEIRTATSMTPFSDGFFTLSISAMNSPNRTYATVKIFVVRERGLLKFVFSRPPADVRQSLPKFRQEIEKALAVPASLNVYDTQFHAKLDGSLDFSSTSSCFQLVGDRGLDLKEMENLLQPGRNVEIDKIYSNFNVQDVQRCTLQLGKAGVTWAQLCVLVIAAFIGLASLVSGCVLCFSYNRWQRFR
uniref:Cadherin domain-containing protein n=2 Tax=Cuerna arida TaxID=1464854 RepID=A0A1B6GN15_9HEMI